MASLKPTPTKASEKRYASDLRKIAKASSMLIMSHVDDWRFDSSALILLAKYAESLTPWATRTAAKMLSDTNSNSDRFFSSQMKSMGKEYNRQLADSIAGMKAKQLQNEQVELIKSIPIKAGLRAQELSQQAAADGKRASEVAKEIARTNEVTENRALLIARTEVSKANATFNQSRAESVGSRGYIWRTATDGDVRPSHAEMEGQFVEWSNPPTLDDMTGHASCLPNCRCFSEIVI